MRNMAVLHSPAFSYPLPVLVRVLFNPLIFKGKILYYNKYKHYIHINCINIAIIKEATGIFPKIIKIILHFLNSTIFSLLMHSNPSPKTKLPFAQFTIFHRTFINKNPP